MIYEENIDNLKKSMQINEAKKTGKHTINKSIPILPFETRNPERPKFSRKMLGVVGELVRIINGKRLVDDFNIEKYIDEIANVVNCDAEEDVIYLKKLIKEYLINKDGDVKIFHINLFNYIELTSGKESKGEEKIAQFLYDLFFKDVSEVNKLFENKESKNMIAKLILLKLNGLEARDVNSVYIDKLRYITSVAKEDIVFLCKHEDFFIKNFDNIIAYYYFYYITQLSIKLNKKKNADFNEVEKIYYLLDWERAGRNRQSNIRGYSYIKNESKNLLININVLEHLNFLFGKKGYSLPEIYEFYDSLDEDKKFDYLSTLMSWISFYRKFFDQEEIQLEMDLDKLIKALEMSILKKIDQATMSRYVLSIEEIGKKYLLKFRGMYKYMLNLNQEMVLLLTAVSIKEDKISLKSLFEEYERRGVFLDKYSKDEVIELLSKLNLIDKKSDSGDAQYVKSIL